MPLLLYELDVHLYSASNLSHVMYLFTLSHFTRLSVAVVASVASHEHEHELIHMTATIKCTRQHDIQLRSCLINSYRAFFNDAFVVKPPETAAKCNSSNRLFVLSHPAHQSAVSLSRTNFRASVPQEQPSVVAVKFARVQAELPAQQTGQQLQLV